MASATSSSNSQNSATKLTSLTPSQHRGSMKDAATDNGVGDAVEEKPPSIASTDPFEDINSEEYIKKFSKYEAAYTLRLMAKYFSDKDIYGGNIFDKSMIADGETIKASRWHCAQSFADPVQFLKEKSTCSSTSAADTTTNISNGKHPVVDDGRLTST